MSFNKRLYDKNKIFSYALSMGFSEFNMWILSPDAHMSSDDFSSNFLDVYLCVKGEERHSLYNSLKEGEESATKEIQKYIKE